MSMMSIKQTKGEQRLFESSRINTQQNRQLQSCNLVAKQISFASPRGRDIQAAVRKNSQQAVQANQGHITEREREESSSEKSDATSSSSSGDSSIDAALNGEDDTEQALYERILAEQEGRDEVDEERKTHENAVEQLVDKNMVNLLIFCTMLKKPTAEEIQQRSIELGPQTCSKLLILDMDETLLHSKFCQIKRPEDAFETGLQADENGVLEFNILISNRPNQPPSTRLNVKLRQNLEEALTYLSTMFEICVFTAGEQDYADAILNFIDPDRSIIKHRLYRQHCVRPEKGVYVKDLSIIKDRNLKDVIIVDNSIISFAFNLSNGIPIKAFLGNKNDEELLFMVTFLEELFSHTDVRTHINQTFKL